MSKLINLSLALIVVATFGLSVSNRASLRLLNQGEDQPTLVPAVPASRGEGSMTEESLRQDLQRERESQRSRLRLVEEHQRRFEQKVEQVEAALSRLDTDIAQLVANADPFWAKAPVADQAIIAGPQTEQQVAAWSEDAFWSEAIDHDWSSETQASVTTALRNSGVEDTLIEEIECHQTACRLVFVHRGGPGDGAFLDSIQTTEAFSQEFVSNSWIDTSGDEITLVYLARAGVSLSTFKAE